MNTYTYASKADKAMALSMDPKVGIINGYAGVVIRSDGQEVWRSGVYRNKASAVLQSNRALPGVRQYLKEHGRDWFDDRQAKHKAQADWKKSRSDTLESLRVATVRGVNARVEGRDHDAEAAQHGYLDGPKLATFTAGYEAAAALPPKPKA
jgi:hypothetical protein